MRPSNAFDFSLRILKLGGQDFRDDRRSVAKRTAILAAIVAYGTFVQVFVDYDGGIQMWLHGFHNFANHLMYVFAFVSIARNRAEIRNVIDSAPEYWPIDRCPGLAKRLENVHRRVVVATRYYLGATLSVMVIMFVNPLFTGMLPDFSSRLRYVGSPYFQLIYVWDLFDFWCLVFTLTGYLSLFYALVAFCYCQVVMLRKEFEGLDVGDEERLKSCVSYHDKLLRLFERICNVFSWFILGQFYSNIINICLPLYIGTMVGVSSVATFSFGITIIIAATLQLYLLCFATSYYSEQVQLLSDSIYQCDWTGSKLSSKAKTAVLLITQRSQKGQDFKAGGILKINMGGFLAIIQLSYSFYTLVLTMQDV